MLTARFFSGLAPGTVACLDRAAKERQYVDGDVLFTRGGPASTVYGLLEGRIKIWWTSEDGVPQTLLLLGPGELVGALAVIKRTAASVSASAAGAIRVIAWSGQVFDAALGMDPRLARQTLDLVAGRAQQMLDRLEEITAVPLEQRIARLLLRLAADGGVDRMGGRLQLRMTRQDLADLASVTVPTVSRVMSRWRRGGLIAGGRGRIELADPRGLAAIAQGSGAVG